jgi:nitrate reductase delta subunit
VICFSLVNKFRVAEAIENSPKEPETLDELDELWKEQEAFSGESSECNTCEDDASLNANNQAVLFC